MKKSYPGSFILNEVGTRAEMARAYGVSERTIYRWLNKAAKESGLTPKMSITNYPGASKVARFKGTRKELAQKYGVSERTAYRWLNKARAEIAAKKQGRSAYPGVSILYETGSNKDLAAKYGVSTRTISKWKAKAETEEGLQPRSPYYLRYDEDGNILDRKKLCAKFRTTNLLKEGKELDRQLAEPEIEEPELITPEEETEPERPPRPEDLEEPWEVDTSDTLPNETIEDLNNIVNALFDFDLLEENSIFKGMDLMEQALLIYNYLEYQYDNFPWRFYKKKTGDEITIRDTNDIINMNIWGNEFEFWLANEMEINRI